MNKEHSVQMSPEPVLKAFLGICDDTTDDDNRYEAGNKKKISLVSLHFK